MAPKHNTGVRTDPAVEAWSYMRENTDRQFKLTPRNLRIGAVLILAVPYAIFKLSQFGQDYKMDPQRVTKSSAE